MTEVCSNCGKYVDQLNEETGWCTECSPKECKRCKRKNDNGREHCWPCIRLIWFEEHADELEELMIKGLSVSAARKELYSRNRPKCIVCNNAIPHGHPALSKICNKTKECRSARRRYRTLSTGPTRLPPQVAMEQVLRELGKL